MFFFPGYSTLGERDQVTFSCWLDVAQFRASSFDKFTNRLSILLGCVYPAGS
jgi:hypothetical protein